MKGKIRYYVVILFAVIPLLGICGPISIKAKLDSASLLMGKQTSMQIEIVQDKGQSGYIPITEGDTLTRNVEIVGWRYSDTTDLGNNREQIDRELILQSFDSGLYTLPPILYISGKDTARTGKLTLKVIPVSVDSLETIHDYKPVQAPNMKWTDYLPDFITDYWWIYLIVILLIAAGTLMYIRKKQGKSLLPPLIPKKVVLPPYEEAVTALKNLKTSQLMHSGQDKEYYTQLTNILRRYISRRFSVAAMENTSKEILSMLNQDEIRPVRDKLQSVFEIADYVKFAKMQPSSAENENSYRYTLDFIEGTKPVEVQSGQQKESAPNKGIEGKNLLNNKQEVK